MIVRAKAEGQAPKINYPSREFVKKKYIV